MMTFESLLAPLSPPLWEDPSCGHSVCPGCCLGMDGWMEGAQGFRSEDFV